MNMMDIAKLVVGLGLALAIGVGASFMADTLYEPKQLAQNAYPVGEEAEAMAAQRAAEAAAREAQQEPFPVLLQNASVSDGEGVARACAACHTFEQGGRNMVGPNLWDIVMAPKAQEEGFRYSENLAAQGAEGEVWNYESLNKFLKNPAEYVPGTNMTYGGVKDAEDRADLIAYMRSLSEDPAPLPDPDAAEDNAAVEDGQATAAEDDVAATEGDAEATGGGSDAGETEAADAEAGDTADAATSPEPMPAGDQSGMQ